MSQTQLEETLLVSLLTAGTKGLEKLPINFRPTVMSVGSLQDIFRVMELCVKEKPPFDIRTVARRCDEKLAEEIRLMINEVRPEDYFSDGQINEAGLELIRRAENPYPETITSESRPPDKSDESIVDVSQFQPMTAAELIEVLGLTIKKDEQNKLITFLAELSTYTRDSQLNISFNAPSSTGKSFIPTEIARLFPQQDVIEVGYCSPTAFFHDVGIYDKDKQGYRIDLSRKILIFLDQPHTLLLQHLRPMLSHDKQEIVLKITDKSQKAGLRTKNIFLRGFPAVIFCTAELKLDEQETTRFLLLSPEADQEKLRQAIYAKIYKESDSAAYTSWLDERPERRLLKERIQAIRREQIEEIRICSPQKIEEGFFSVNKLLKPKHQRDIGRLIGLVKAFALLNLWYREREGSTIVANDDDVAAAFSLWGTISQSQEYNLPPFIYDIFRDVVLPAWQEKNQGGTDGAGLVAGLTRKEISAWYYKVYGRLLDSVALRQQILPMLETAGLISQEPDPDDKRKLLVHLATVSDTGNNSGTDGGVPF